MLLSEWLAALKLDCQRVCDPESCESKWKKTLRPHFMKQERQREKKAEKRGWKATEREEEGTTCKLASSQKKWLDGTVDVSKAWCMLGDIIVDHDDPVERFGARACWALEKNNAERQRKRREELKQSKLLKRCYALIWHAQKRIFFTRSGGVQKLLESKVWISVYCVLLLYCIWYLFRRPVPDWVAATPRLQCINFLLV